MHQWSIGRPLLNNLAEGSAAAEATPAATAEVVQKTVHEDQTEAVEEETSAVASSAALSESENSEDDMPLSQKFKQIHEAKNRTAVDECAEQGSKQGSKHVAETLQREQEKASKERQRKKTEGQREKNARKRRKRRKSSGEAARSTNTNREERT